MLSDDWYRKAKGFFTKEQRDTAKAYLESMHFDRRNFMAPGRRNNDAVNLMIVSAALGVPPDEAMWSEDYIDANKSNVTKEHFDELRERIEPYLVKWMRYSNPLKFMVDANYLF
jgi:hypothetical protein